MTVILVLLCPAGQARGQTHLQLAAAVQHASAAVATAPVTPLQQTHPNAVSDRGNEPFFAMLIFEC